MQWRRLAPVLVVAGALVLGACLESNSQGADGSGGGAAGATTLPGSTAAGDPTSSTAGATEVPVTEAPTTVAPATTAAVVKVPIGRNLRQGVKGDDVKMLQQRLIDLKFDPGAPDGQFGPTTTQAVWAY